jgi:hypothetical protein
MAHCRSLASLGMTKRRELLIGREQFSKDRFAVDEGRFFH